MIECARTEKDIKKCLHKVNNSIAVSNKLPRPLPVFQRNIKKSWPIKVNCHMNDYCYYVICYNYSTTRDAGKVPLNVLPKSYRQYNAVSTGFKSAKPNCEFLWVIIIVQTYISTASFLMEMITWGSLKIM